MKAYVITQGCYSDYHICAVTLDYEKAQRLKKLAICHDDDHVEIEEYELDKIEYEFSQAQLELEPIKYWEIEIIYDVKQRKVRSVKSYEHYKTGDKAVLSTFNERIVVLQYLVEKPISYELCVREDDEEKAKKIALDRFYMKLSEKYGM